LACSLLKIDQANFRKWLTHKTLKVGAEVMEKKMNANQAIVARDSVAKFIYSLLFDWLVNVVNLKLATKQPMSTATFIGVLDIYGFEHFKTNSFEQFCINYANEKLQQEFTRHVFKLEQEEYVAEGINWSFIDFTDNGPCIDLIESKLGILSLLDEETRLPSGTDKNFVVKLYSNFGTNHPFFAKPKFGETEFVIKHYAIDVSYSIDGFIEKNKDTVTDQQLGVLNASTFPYLKEVITIPQLVESAAPSRGAAPKKPTLGSIFRQSLVKLMDTLRATHPHYIRCIKPNQAKEPFAFEPQNVLDQLIACGVLETIKISRAGYPSKQSYESFANRYYLLSPSTNWKKAHKDLSVAIAKTNITKEGMFEIGKTKIFFRAGQLAYLEKLRIKTFEKYVVLIQKNFKRNVCQKRFKIMRKKAIKIQSIWRMYHAIKVFEELREKRIKEAAAAFELAASIARVSGKSIVMPDIPPPSPLVKARKAKKPTVASVKAHKSATEKRRTEQAEKDEKERKEMERKLAENEEQLTKFKAQYSQMDSDFKKRANIDVGGLEELQILVAKLASEKKAMRREMAELNNTIDEKDEELIKIRKQADKHKKQNDDNANKIAALEKEVAGNRKQLSEFVSQKYKDDEQSANFFTAYPETEKVGLAAASSAMKTVEWAAKLAGSYTGTVRPTASSNFREVEFSEPIERPIRMLESKDLEDEITSTLISDLKIRIFY
jgi:myosin-5